jgi:3-hydroxyisobutyrate dehydrogenase-like beta-hydroxyacid dehydrogenase
MKVGFVGMGIMGSPMSQNLLRAGHEVMVWNRTPARCEAARAAGAGVARKLSELGAFAEVLCLCVSDTPDVEAVLFGDEGLAESLREGQVVVDLSTISPTATEEFAEMLAAQGAAMLDAPVSGGEAGAVQGTLTIMVGGEAEVLERVRPVLEAMGKKIVHCGGHGAGQRVKAVNQVICALNILALSEGLAFAQQAGLEVATVLDAVSSGAAGSWMLSNLGPKVVAGDWAPGFMIRLQAKDLRIALEEMQEAGAPCEGTTLTARLFAEAAEQGLGDEGTQALIKLLW